MQLELLKKISFHDSEVRAYKRNENDITFLIADGMLPNTYFKITLKNVKVEVMDSKPETIQTSLYYFNNIFKYCAPHHIDDGEIGICEDDNKKYLKIYIDCPLNKEITSKEERGNYKFDGLNVGLCHDYNYTNNAYIKFIMDDFEVEEF